MNNNNNMNNNNMNNNIITKINNMHEPIQNHIYSFYWSNIFYESVIQNLNDYTYEIIKITNYIKKHALPNTIVKSGLHFYYYKKHNKLLEKIFKSFALNRFFKNHPFFNNYIHYYNMLLLAGICSKVKDEYKYFCAFVLSIISDPIYNSYNHYVVLEYFKSI